MIYIWIVIAAVVTAADQFGKFLISAGFAETDHFTLIPALIDIVYVENRGCLLYTSRGGSDEEDSGFYRRCRRMRPDILLHEIRAVARINSCGLQRHA